MSITYHNNVKLEPIQLAFLTLQLYSNGTHLLWRYPLVGHTLVVDVHYCGSDVNTHNGFNVRDELPGDEAYKLL